MKRPQSSLCECEIRGWIKGLWTLSLVIYFLSPFYWIWLCCCPTLDFALLSGDQPPCRHHYFYFLYISSCKAGSHVAFFFNFQPIIYDVCRSKEIYKMFVFGFEFGFFYLNNPKITFVFLDWKKDTTCIKSTQLEMRTCAVWTCSRLYVNESCSAHFVIAGGSQSWLYVLPWCAEVGS